MHRVLALILFLLCGCSTLGDTPPDGPLATQIGQHVDLTGPMGIGKLANYVGVGQQGIYLFAPTTNPDGLTPEALKPGTVIRVRGKLEYHPDSGRSPRKFGKETATGIAPHYFIRGASVQVMP